ncbi:unnamed protein product [Orchesella dallaii]|uniref:Uncharacterized protein n=1 Tax=Orchesella dallaii TaxID=48710 RepID=A0ABP1RW79_9HEXA
MDSRAWKITKSDDDETYRDNFIRINEIDVNYMMKKASEDGKEEILESECMDLMNLAYDCIAQEYQSFNIHFSVPIVDLLKEISEALFKESRLRKGDDEMKLRFCYIRFSYEPSLSKDNVMSGEDKMLALAVLKEGVEMYPENAHFYIVLVGVCYTLEDCKTGLYYAENGVEKFPNNLQLLFSKASMLLMSSFSFGLDSEAKRVDEIAAFQGFLSMAPEDHPSVLYAYYHTAAAYAGEMDSANGKSSMERFYKMGKLAEKKMLPCAFQQKKHDLRTAVETLLSYTGNKEAAQKIKEMLFSARRDIFRRKPYLDNPNRKDFVISHRKFMNEMIRLKGDAAQLLKFFTKHEILPKVIQKLPKKSQLKTITLKEMSSKSDTIYEDCVINLIIIEEPHVPGWIQVIVQDKNGDVTRLYIHDEEMSKGSLNKFGVGKKIAVYNPSEKLRNIRIRALEC